jgi:hypothetical protein
MKFVFFLVFMTSNVFAQAIYDANGQYKGYSQTSLNGAYEVTNTAIPTPIQPKITINTPRQAPQALVMRGW